MKLIERLHETQVSHRRARVLAGHLAELLPPGAHVLDVGSGDGLLARLIMDRRDDLEFRGIDVLARQHSHIPMEPFDGLTIPFDEGSFDAVMFVDVLHHTFDPRVLLKEAIRVTRGAIVLKDHTRDGLLAGPTLRFMDRVGNARHGVALPYNYWPQALWQQTFSELDLTVEVWRRDLGLYPWPASCFFSRSLHFIARLKKTAA